MREPADLLAQVIDQDVERGDNGHPQIRQGVARDRVISHSDPRDLPRAKVGLRFDGHKLDVIGDEDSELILGVEVQAGNAGDGEGDVGPLEAVQGDGVEVETLLGDMAYSDGDVREAVESAGAELVAKVPPVTNSGRFPKTDFAIDTKAGRSFRFPTATCATCPLRAHCVGGERADGLRRPPPRPHRRRPCRPGRARDHGPAAPAVQDRPPPGPGHYRGRRKTRLQALLAATVANFKGLGVLGAFEAPARLAVAA